MHGRRTPYVVRNIYYTVVVIARNDNMTDFLRSSHGIELELELECGLEFEFGLEFQKLGNQRATFKKLGK